MKTVLRIFSEHSCAYVDFLCTNKTIGLFLENNFGFKQEPEEYQVLPARFSPIELKKKKYNFEYFSKEKKIIPLDSFYITSADGDIDRPQSISHPDKLQGIL
jgi:hypothetical protein